MKQLCDKENCKKMAVWYYMPASEDVYYCDEHISRGCSCNINPDTNEEDKDGLGRLLPCVEYDYNEKGYDLDKHTYVDSEYDEDD